MKRILCFGDSITDMRRDRGANSDFPFALGNGYVFLLASELGKHYPNECEIINRGIGGNRSCDLLPRLKEDVIDLKPDAMILLIGVNDVWHGIDDPSRGVSIEQYKKNVEQMFDEIQTALPDIKIFVFEPFILHGDATDYQGHYERFTQVFEYAKTMQNIAKTRQFPFIPLQNHMNEIAEKYGNSYLLFDGVHPSVNGSRVMMEELMKVLPEALDL